MSLDIDFTVYAQQRIPYIERHSRRGRHGHLIVEAATSIAMPESVRYRLSAIAGLWWLKIYENVDACGNIAVYAMPPLEEDHYFVIKYGDESMKGWLTSSRLLIMHRETAEVFYAGSAGDEG